jgi:hypothetical protein
VPPWRMSSPRSFSQVGARLAEFGVLRQLDRYVAEGVAGMNAHEMRERVGGEAGFAVAQHQFYGGLASDVIRNFWGPAGQFAPHGLTTPLLFCIFSLY